MLCLSIIFLINTLACLFFGISGRITVRGKIESRKFYFFQVCFYPQSFFGKTISFKTYIESITKQGRVNFLV